MHTWLKIAPAAGLALLLAAGGASADCSDTGVTCSTADVDQIPGNIAIIRQNGSANTAIIEQQAISGATYANAASIHQENSTGSYANITQQNGSRLAATIQQNGDYESATITQGTATQPATNLGVQISQYGTGTTISVTQFGTGVLNGSPITIKQFK